MGRVSEAPDAVDQIEVGVPFMRRVPPVTNPSAKFSGVHQANLLETTQPPGERLRL
jgi:hypothetical protein